MTAHSLEENIQSHLQGTFCGVVCDLRYTDWQAQVALGWNWHIPSFYFLTKKLNKIRLDRGECEKSLNHQIIIYKSLDVSVARRGLSIIIQDSQITE